MDIKILVAAHKPYWISPDDVYLPIHVGRADKLDLGFIGDDTGDNISYKNPSYCELTGIYWAWRNLKAEYIGLCHYRRYFSFDKGMLGGQKKERILKSGDYLHLLETIDCLLPVKRNYYIETVRSQYEHAHYKKDLDLLETLIQEKYPEYQNAFSKVMENRKLHLLNMFVMKWELFDDYCKFLFPLLFELESRIDMTGYSNQEKRVFGFLGERLLNVWLVKNQIQYKEVSVVFLENINWLKKGSTFLKRKFLGRK